MPDLTLAVDWDVKPHPGIFRSRQALTTEYCQRNKTSKISFVHLHLLVNLVLIVATREGVGWGGRGGNLGDILVRVELRAQKLNVQM